MKRKNKRGLMTLMLSLIMIVSLTPSMVFADKEYGDGGSHDWGNDNQSESTWNCKYVLCQEYMSNSKDSNDLYDDPLKYNFQTDLTSITAADKLGKEWTFAWLTNSNGSWECLNNEVSDSYIPEFDSSKIYTSKGKAGTDYKFRIFPIPENLSGWNSKDNNEKTVNWCYYLRFVNDYTVNLYTPKDGGGYNKDIKENQQFVFWYPDNNLISDSQCEDTGLYTDPLVLKAADYVKTLAQGYEYDSETTKNSNDGTDSIEVKLKGSNILNIYCKLKDYMISYDANQGTLANKADHTTSYTVRDGITIDDNPTRDGYTFRGWSVTQSDSNTEGENWLEEIEATTLSLDKGLYGNVKLTAKWDKEYSLNYDANGGQGAPIDNTKYYAGSIATISSDIPTCEEKKFMGWTTTKDDASTKVTGTVKFAETDTQNITLYALWRADTTYTLTYYSNDGTNKTQVDTTKYHLGDNNIPLLATSPWTRDGYTFGGWELKDGTDVTKVTFSTGNIEVYAIWIVKDYTISYDANGGQGAPIDNTKYYAGSTATISNDIPTYEGKKFMGWTTTKNDASTKVTGTVKFATTDAENITLYALWEEKDLHLIYNSNGGIGTVPVDNSIYKTGDNKTLVDKKNVELTKENCTFLGWAEGSPSAAITTSVAFKTSDIEVYAIWTVVKENPPVDPVPNPDPIPVPNPDPTPAPDPQPVPDNDNLDNDSDTEPQLVTDKKSIIPKTGDKENLVLWIVFLVTAILAAGTMTIAIKREEN